MVRCCDPKTASMAPSMTRENNENPAKQRRGVKGAAGFGGRCGGARRGGRAQNELYIADHRTPRKGSLSEK